MPNPKDKEQRFLNWEEALDLESKMNDEVFEKIYPIWKFDLDFKLDFDGPVISVSSRFYPEEKTWSGPWKGSLNFWMKSIHLGKVEISAVGLSDLKSKVDDLMKEMREAIEPAVLDFLTKKNEENEIS